jgi:two-component system LytT family response regulator
MTLHGRSFMGAAFASSGAQASTTRPGVDLHAPMAFAGRGDAGSRGGESKREGTTGANPASYLDRIVIRSRSRILLLDVREVAWLEAYGNYVRFHTLGEVHTVRGTLTSFERRLDPTRFIRIHRSAVVNLDVIRELHTRRTGDFTLITATGEQLTMSRNFRNRVPQLRRLLAS